MKTKIFVYHNVSGDQIYCHVAKATSNDKNTSLLHNGSYKFTENVDKDARSGRNVVHDIFVFSDLFGQKRLLFRSLWNIVDFRRVFY